MAIYDREAVRCANRIEDVVAELTGQTLRRRGQELIGICPFHDDNTPSLNVNPEKGTYLCRSWKASGDVFTFVEHINRCTFPEALRFLGERTAIRPSVGMTRTHTAPAPDTPRPSRIRPEQIEREHLYNDGQLRKLLLKERDAHGKKQMVWEHRDYETGAWLAKKGTEEPQLYRFSEAVAYLTPTRRLVLAEGEKDVDALLALKFPSTTLPHGAGSEFESAAGGTDRAETTH